MIRVAIAVFVGVIAFAVLLLRGDPEEPGDQPAEVHEHMASLSADEELAAGAAPLPPVSNLAGFSLPRIPFVNVTEHSKIRFHHDRGLSDERLLPETMGSGCAVIDFDNDGLSDVVFVTSTAWSWSESTDEPSTLSAWRNLGNLTFEDVTENIGLDFSLYGMGAAVADYDNDGDEDLYITAVGGNRLLRNDTGVFHDVTATTGVAGDETTWSTSAAWFDYDCDGDLDLFVGNYVKWNRGLEQVVDAISFSAEARFGSPDAYPPESPYLFRNDGGSFVETAAAVGVAVPTKTLGIAVFDANRDGRPDVFLANDGVADQLYLNDSEDGFREAGLSSGVAYGDSGAPRAGMGVDVADFRNDGSWAIAVGHYENEMSGLFVEVDNGIYRDESLRAGIGRDSLADLTWGVRWSDLDLDGRLDLIATNGHVEQSPIHLSEGSTYLQPVQIYWNAGKSAPREFVPLPADSVGNAICGINSGRAMAIEDFDNDGDCDVITVNSGRESLVFRNDLINAKNDGSESPQWVQFRLRGDGENCPVTPIGATIHLITDKMHQRRVLSSARGYMSSGSLRSHFGLGTADSEFLIRVTWPDGTDQTFDGLPDGQIHQLVYSTSEKALKEESE